MARFIWDAKNKKLVCENVVMQIGGEDANNENDSKAENTNDDITTVKKKARGNTIPAPSSIKK